jgi:hypothetical protein
MNANKSNENSFDRNLVFNQDNTIYYMRKC